jgi:tetratricopeptide (TPR) repeat protein
LLLRGARELIASELDEAERTAQEAFKLGTRMGISVATTVYGAHLVRIYCEQGRLDELIGLAYQAAEETPSLPGWRPAIMFMLCQIGRLQEASELFDQEIATGLSGLAFDITWLQSMSYLADCACDLGKLAAAPGLYERMLPYRERFIFVGSEDQGAVARPLGRLATLLGRFDEAESHLRYALDFHRRLSAPFWIARTQVDLAAMLVARRRNGDLDEAGTLIDAATVTMRERGYGGLTRAIADIQGRL